MKASEVMSQISTMTTYQASAKANNAKSTCFQDVMDTNLQSKQDDKKTSAAVDKKSENASKMSNLEQNTSKDADKKVVNSSKKDSATKTEAQTTQKNPIADKIDQATKEIKNILMENLDITEEQLESIMTALGLDYLQLLEPSNLAQVFMEVNGLTDPTQMLTDQQLSDQFSQLITEMNDVKLEDYGLTNEEVNQYLEQLTAPKVETGAKEEVVGTAEVQTNTEDDVVNENAEKTNTNAETQNIKVEVEKYSTDADTQSSDQQQQKSEGAIEQANAATIVNNIAKSTTVESFGDELVQVQQLRDIANQVIEQIKVVIKPEQTSMEMHLNPESLGKVNLLVAQKEGVLTAQFTVQNDIAKEALESQIQTLKDNFSQQGIKVDAVEVTVSNFPFSQDDFTDGNKEQQKSSSKKRNINLADLDFSESDYSEEEELKVDMMQKNGNSIDYSA
ncbi:flagellar hook-length control protein FliK [Anaerosporobacter faecicola]|uniref:flagellar hook-length control protein FliK n=1 Tax=Anaerosporobacter faecicola TaxID=2718714 RepID=UPI00143B78BA|nr:flagellar hook-length control protein FliK [Anaerosporobacter faecicola]